MADPPGRLLSGLWEALLFLLTFLGVNGEIPCGYANESLTAPQIRIVQLSPFLAAATCIESMGTSADSLVFDDNHQVKLSHCIDGQWTDLNSICYPTPKVRTCTTPPAALPDAYIDETLLGNNLDEPSNVGHVYRCDEGKAFLSGAPALVSQCFDSEWTPIHDVCVEACSIPRDCSEVLRYTTSDDGLKNISPSGRSDLGVQVLCSSINGSRGWTTVLRSMNESENYLESKFEYEDYLGSKFEYEDYLGSKFESGNYSESKFRFGYGDSSDGNSSYFIGMNHLSSMGFQKNGLDRPLVILILLEDDNGAVYHATYSNVTFDEETGEIFTSATFYGNAGNCWHTENGTFLEPQLTQCNLLSSPLTWLDLQNLKTAQMFVRPVAYDREVSCPVLDLDSSLFPESGFVLPGTRTVGSSLNFSCPELFVEENSGLRNWSAICEEDIGSGPPRWSRTPEIPCVLNCPQDFINSSDETHCLHFTENGHDFGVYKAVKACSKKNHSSLILMTAESEIRQVPEKEFYYTGHIADNNSELIMSPSSLDIACNSMSSSCEPTADKRCMAVTKDLFKIYECDDSSLKAMCRLPALCPPGFKQHNGICYKLKCSIAIASIYDYLGMCIEEGAALAYPESMDVLDFFYDITAQAVGSTTDSVILFIGLNNVDDDWTANGLYEPDEEILYLAGNSSIGDNFRTLHINFSDAYSFLEPAQITSDIASCGICQYLAFPDCWKEPPTARDNMYLEWNGSLAYGAEAIYRCYAGYFFEEVIGITKFSITCGGQLGNWFPAFSRCLPVDLCQENDLTLPPMANFNVTRSDNHQRLNGTISYSCPDRMVTNEGDTTQTVKCIERMGGGYGFKPSSLEECHVACLDEPLLNNDASSNWSNTTVYKEGHDLTVTCNVGYQITPGITDQIIKCTANGDWEESVNCYRACIDAPPLAQDNMKASSETNNSVGVILTYTCNEGFYLPVNETHREPRNHILVECSQEGSWVPKDSLACFKLCLEDPVPSNPQINHTWDGYSRALDTEIFIFCGENQLLGDLTDKKTVVCEGNETWTSYTPDILTCIPGTLKQPTAVPPEDIGAVLESPNPPYKERDSVIYMCEEGKLSPMGTNSFIVNFTKDGWTDVDEEFICYDAADELPKIIATDGEQGTVSGPDPLYYVGVKATYTCPEKSTYLGRTFIEIPFTPNGWAPIDPDFICMKESYIPPVLPSFAIRGGSLIDDEPPFPVGANVTYMCNPGWGLDNRYRSNTANFTVLTYLGDKWSEMDPDFVCVPDPNASIPPPTTEPPFRFPDANVLENGYDKTTAVHMPSLEHFLTNANEDAPEFMLTAGPFGFGYAVALNSGDRQCLMRKNYAVSDDCSHNPKDCTTGFSMSIWERLNISFDVFHTIHKYHEDEKRYVLSTGGDHNGHPGVSIYHQGLYLIAVVSTGDEYWEVKVLGPVAINEWNNIGIRWIKGDGSSGGLELYVNARKVGQVHEGKSAVAKAELAPTELLIGCHRDADDAVYRHYNDADFDEFALWTEWLDDEETIYFLGGYEGESENLDPEEFAVMLERTNLRDPEQAAIAMAMFNGMADQLKDKNNTTGEEGNSTELNEGAKKLKGLADAFAQLTNPHLIKRDLTLEELESYAAIIDAASKMFDESLETDWDDIEATGHRGSIGVKKDLEEYIKTICKKLKFDGQPLNFTRTTDNIAVKIDKMTVSDFKGLGKFYITPNFRESKQMLSLQSAWDLPSDKVEVPTDVISDPRCRDHPISVATAYYDTFDDVGPSTINPEEMNAMVDNEVDSRVISVDIVSDATDLASPSTCEPEKKKLEKNPLFITKEHKMKNFTQRSLKFHEGENTSPIYRRICVWWNYTIGVQGAWDATGCSLLVTNQFFSKCACAHSGTFSIIAEYLEEREVMEEPYWATVVKYIGHILSAICIVFYVLVVGLSGDLKDQFHISGVFLALSVLGGGIALLISDSDRIRDGRHSCTAIGSLIHALYLNAAAWVAMIGHAGFKAVTGGIIGGFMNPYIMISSGVTLVSVGFTYLFFIFDLGTDPRCFISWFNEIKFLFFFPVLAYAMAGIFFNCVIYFNTSHASKTKKLIMHDYGNFALGSTFMIFYFTLVWILGFMSYMRFEEELGAYPWFQVFNSFMGVVILIGLGLCSTKFKMVLAGQAKRRRELLQKLHLGQGKNVGGNKLKNDVGPAPTQIKS